MRSNSPSPPTGALVHDSSWSINRRVIGALILREMLTRYGRNNLGFLWLFLEPMLFTLVVTAFWAATRTIHGSHIPIVAFAVTGYSSVMLWRNMPSRCIGALKSNKALLHHRQVTIVDIYLSRIVLEQMAATTAFVVLGLSLTMIGWMPAPENAMRVLGGWLLLGWFGAGLALVIGSLSERFDVIGKLWPPFSYLLFPLSGVAFLVDALPPRMQDIVAWLPMLNALEYLRDGWFGSLFHAHYDLGYVLVFNLVLFFAGLSLARQVGFDSSSDE